MNKNTQIILDNIQVKVENLLSGYVFSYNDISTRLKLKTDLEQLVGCEVKDSSFNDEFIFYQWFNPSTGKMRYATISPVKNE